MCMRYLFSFLLFLVINISNAQVLINEYSSSNLNLFMDNHLKTEDWIELYNSSNEDINISGWHLSDKPDKSDKWMIPEGTIISANGYLVFWCSGRDESSNGIYHTNFKLSQTSGKDHVVLSNANGEILDQYELAQHITHAEHSNCRIMDGGNEWEICTQPTLSSSNNGSSNFKSYTKAPTIELGAGYYSGNQMVNITNNEPNSTLRYTTDGSHPTAQSPEFAAPIEIAKTTVVKALSFSNDASILPGKIDFSTYFIDEEFTLAVFSVASEDVIDLANGNGELIPIGSLEYFDKTKERTAVSFGSLNRHGQDSWVLDHRSIDWVSRDEMGYSKAVNAPLFSYSKRDAYQKFMFRNSGDDNYPAIDDGSHEGSTHIRDEYVQTLAQEGGMKLDQRAVERVILFLNGEYWGVYGMRERPVDHDYTKEYYDQGKYDLQYLTTWGFTTIQYGGDQAQRDWINLRDFILQNDMSEPLNYKIADDSINLVSLIDYMVVNLNVVASDWLNYNTGWWRGRDPKGDHKKWGYILWDLDATFDYYINYSGVPNTSPNAVPCDLVTIAEFMDQFFFGGEGSLDVGQHEKIFLKLLKESPVFKQLYYSRYADMMNTVYSCENMIETLDKMLAVIAPEMPRQIQRWGGTVSGWEQNVQELKSFIEQRCALLDDGLLDCHQELSGPYKVILKSFPEEVGSIKLNTLKLKDLPWSGDYFGGMDNLLSAKINKDYKDTYQFDHWESKSGNIITPNITDKDVAIQLTGLDTITAVFSLVNGTEDLLNGVTFEVFPNPTDNQFGIRYELKETGNVDINIYSTIGRHVQHLQKIDRQNSGIHMYDYNVDDLLLSSGIYFVQLNINEQVYTKKLTILE